LIIRPEKQGSTVDVLADVLRVTRVSGRVFCRSEFTAPWAIAFPAGKALAFHLVDRGSCWLRLAGDRRPLALAGGDLVVIPQLRGHVISDAPRTRSVPFDELLSRGGGEPLGTTVVRYGGGGVPTTLVCGVFLPAPGTDHAVLAQMPEVIHIKGDGGRAVPWLESTLRFLTSEAGANRPGAQTITDRLTDVLFIQVLRSWMESLPPNTGGWLGALRDPALATALAQIHRDPAHEWNVSSLARQAGMSRSVFAARFRAVVGEPPLGYVGRWRMQLAANALRDTDESLSEVGASVGFASAVAFNRAFKRAFGIPPGAFRDRAREETSA
jgi:AraC-like DNA-binding protein